jgi:hypothetical protein
LKAGSLTARLPHWAYLGSGSPTRSKPEAERKGELQAIKDRLVFPMDIPAEELTNRTFSLAMDIGMYFSQVYEKLPVPQMGTATWQQKVR